MKKRLLFVTQYLHTGGIEKSLLTLLSDLDYERYEVDLLLFDHSGVLFKLIPPQVNILPPLFETFSTSLSQAVPELLKSRKYRILIGKIAAAGLSRLSPGVGTGVRWEVYRHILRAQKKYYDVAISYIDFFCNYYVTEKVQAKMKIVYNHMDYGYSKKNGWPCPRLDRKSFSESNHIVSVAETSKDALQSFFPEFSKKIQVIHNRVSPETVRALAKEENIVKEMKDDNKVYIVTVARLVEEKGVFFALHACKILVERGVNVCWYLVGNGPLYNELNKQAVELGLQDHFILLGERENPYPYMDFCNVYVQPSKTEAHCVAVEEAIALNSPIVVTDIPSFRNQIQNRETGLIVKSNPHDIAEGITTLLESKELRERLINNLRNISNRYQEPLKQFNNLIEGKI